MDFSKSFVDGSMFVDGRETKCYHALLANSISRLVGS
jgi:hypothetical protein